MKQNIRVSVFAALVFGCIQGCVSAVYTAEGKKQECEDKTLGSFLSTPHSVFSADIRKMIAQFAAPKQSAQYPIDFLIGATIVPPEWGKLCDVYRDPSTEHIKILCCRFGSPNDAYVKKIRKYAWLAPFCMTLCLTPCIMWLNDDTERCWGIDGPKAFTSAAGITLATAGASICSMVNDMYKSYSHQRAINLSCPQWQALIIDLASMKIESRVVVSEGGILDRPHKLYFLQNAHAIAVERGSDIFERFCKEQGTSAFRMLSHTEPVDAFIKTMRKSRNNEYLNIPLRPEFDMPMHVHATYWKGLQYCPIPGDGEHPGDEAYSKALAMWLERHVMPSPVALDFFDRVYLYEQIICGSLAQMHGAKKSIRLDSANNAPMTLRQFTVSPPSPQGFAEISDAPSMMLPSCSVRENTYAITKTRDSECVVLKIDGRTVCIDLTMEVSPEIKILLKNILETGRLPMSKRFFQRSSKNKFSLERIPPMRRKKIIENMRIFCGVQL